jgi:hypothetical protein
VHVILAAGFTPILAAKSSLTSLANKAPSLNHSSLNNKGLSNHPVIDTPNKASALVSSSVSLPKKGKSVYPDCSVPIIVAALTLFRNSCLVFIPVAFISDRLQKDIAEFPVLGFMGMNPISTPICYSLIKGD